MTAAPKIWKDENLDVKIERCRNVEKVKRVIVAIVAFLFYDSDSLSGSPPNDLFTGSNVGGDF